MKSEMPLSVRGREYLRIIYGPEYSLQHNLQGLKKPRPRREAITRAASSFWDWNH